MFYSEGQATFQLATRKGIPCGTLEIVIQEILWSIRGSYSAIWSIPVTNVKWHFDPWPTMTSQLIRLSTNFMTFIPSLTFTELWVVSMEHLQRVWLANMERLHFRTPGSVPPFRDLLVLQFLRPDSSNLPCLYSTFRLQYSLVPSRFCSVESIYFIKDLSQFLRREFISWVAWQITIALPTPELCKDYYKFFYFLVYPFQQRFCEIVCSGYT